MCMCEFPTQPEAVNASVRLREEDEEIQKSLWKILVPNSNVKCDSILTANEIPSVLLRGWPAQKARGSDSDSSVEIRLLCYIYPSFFYCYQKLGAIPDCLNKELEIFYLPNFHIFYYFIIKFW